MVATLILDRLTRPVNRLSYVCAIYVYVRVRLKKNHVMSFNTASSERYNL